MNHNERCENAKLESRCCCRCGGSQHGLKNMRGNPDGERKMNVDMGGEIGVLLKSLEGDKFQCTCRTMITVNDWLGYPHEGGLVDKDGKKWWIYVECPNCKYQWSWWKVEVEVERQERYMNEIEG